MWMAFFPFSFFILFWLYLKILFVKKRSAMIYYVLHTCQNLATNINKFFLDWYQINVNGNHLAFWFALFEKKNGRNMRKLYVNHFIIELFAIDLSRARRQWRSRLPRPPSPANSKIQRSAVPICKRLGNAAKLMLDTSAILSEWVACCDW